MRKNSALYFIVCLVTFLTMTIVSAQDMPGIPTVVNYQGSLTDENGKALSDSYDLVFRLYPDTNKTSNWEWSEQQSVVVTNGLFNVLLGSVTPLTPADLVGDKFLGITIEGELEMKPRLRLASVPFSFHADKLDNKDAVDFVSVEGDSVTGTLVLAESSQLEVAGKTKVFGNRQILYNEMAPLVTTVLVEGIADTDGFIVAVASVTPNNANFSLDGYIKINDTFTRFATAAVNSISGEDYPIYTNSFTMPVRMGEEWNVTGVIYHPNTVQQHAFIYWIPLGNISQ